MHSSHGILSLEGEYAHFENPFASRLIASMEPQAFSRLLIDVPADFREKHFPSFIMRVSPPISPDEAGPVPFDFATSKVAPANGLHRPINQRMGPYCISEVPAVDKYWASYPFPMPDNLPEHWPTFGEAPPIAPQYFPDAANFRSAWEMQCKTATFNSFLVQVLRIRYKSLWLSQSVGNWYRFCRSKK